MADLLERLSGIQRGASVERLGLALEAETFIHFDDAVRENIDNAVLAAVIWELESDDSVDFIECLETSDRQDILDAISEQERVLLEDSLSYPEDSASRLMRRASANVPSYWMVGQTIDHMRLDAEMPNNFCLLMVVGPTHEPLGVVPLATLDATGLISQRLSMPISCVYQRKWIRKTLPPCFANAVWCRRRWWRSRGGWWVRSTLKTSFMLSTKKTEEDILKFGGVREKNFYEAVIGTFRSRF
ncbi:MAG: hypothetical protein VX639_05370 [Pseudomonadota bacterium]|nr:hypothetical protein [Pseudomonadota bacterium]